MVQFSRVTQREVQHVQGALAEANHGHSLAVEVGEIGDVILRPDLALELLTSPDIDLGLLARVVPRRNDDCPERVCRNPVRRRDFNQPAVAIRVSGVGICDLRHSGDRKRSDAVNADRGGG